MTCVDVGRGEPTKSKFRSKQLNLPNIDSVFEGNIDALSSTIASRNVLEFIIQFSTEVTLVFMLCYERTSGTLFINYAHTK